ncbi:MAG: 1,4-dihydroxy-2-naphthoate polyprenyltransferase [Candidatus Latescibacterota bacterium]|nr:MAG: 1,4-dihydroxy-2-naphthoate polyprenyltransferase [Candidatus Latescibacterota bacterium]
MNAAPGEASPHGFRPGSARAWILAARPATLTAAATPVLVGTACAARAGAFRAGPALAALAGALLLQIGSNFANDLFDHEKGADTAERIGPTRAVQSGLLTPRAMRSGTSVVFALALLVGLYLAFAAGWPVVVIGLFSIASAIAYTGGPFPLGYHGFGDLFVFVFFGFVAVCGTAFVQAGEVPSLAWAASLPIASLATAILVVNNLRDADTDRQAGKKTIPARFGRGAARIEYAALLVVAYAVPAALVVARVLSPWALLPLATLPLAARATRVVFASTDGPTLNRTLETTARLLLLHGVLFAAGIAAGGSR